MGNAESSDSKTGAKSAVASTTKTATASAPTTGKSDAKSNAKSDAKAATTPAAPEVSDRLVTAILVGAGNRGTTYSNFALDFPSRFKVRWQWPTAVMVFRFSDWLALLSYIDRGSG